MRSAKIISFNSQKGGVGKTTSSIHIAIALSLGGFKTLLIDVDPQGSVQSALKVDKSPKYGTFELFCEKNVVLSSLLNENFNKNLHIIYSNIYQLRSEHAVLKVAADYNFLSQWIDEYAMDDYDFIILDSPASTGVLSINAMLAANLIVIPIQCQALAVRSLKRFLKAFKDLQNTINPSLRLAGILLTMYDKSIPSHRYVCKHVYNRLGNSVFETIIPNCKEIQNVSVMGGDVIQRRFTSIGATGYIRFTNELLNRFKLRDD